MSDREKPKSPYIGALILSILAAAIGIQKKKNLEEDFSQSSPIPYILGGIIFTALFISTLIFVAKMALAE